MSSFAGQTSGKSNVKQSSCVMWLQRQKLGLFGTGFNDDIAIFASNRHAAGVKMASQSTPTCQASVFWLFDGFVFCSHDVTFHQPAIKSQHVFVLYNFLHVDLVYV